MDPDYSTGRDADIRFDRSGDRARDRRLLWPAIILSLLLHGGVLGLLWHSKLFRTPPVPESPVVPNQVAVRLFDSSQLRPAREPPAPPQQTVPQPDLIPPPRQSEPQPQQAIPAAPPEPAGNVSVPPPRPEISLPEQGPVAPPTPGPDLSTDNVRLSIRQMQEARQAQGWRHDCNERQERSELLDCAQETSNPNLELLDTNPVYQALNPVRQISRSQRTVSTVMEQRDDLAARLRESDVDPLLGDYVLQELEAGITENSNPGDRSVETIIRMTDQSAAAQQAREIFGDSWIIQRSRELRQRKVHID